MRYEFVSIQAWLYACGIVGGHRHHWNPGGVVAAGYSGCPRGGTALAVRQQDEATGAGGVELRVGEKSAAVCEHAESHDCVEDWRMPGRRGHSSDQQRPPSPFGF